jgi:hypothetical protein
MVKSSWVHGWHNQKPLWQMKEKGGKFYNGNVADEI